MRGLTSSQEGGCERACARPRYERVTVRELALRYELENAALDVEQEAERSRFARERRPAHLGPAAAGVDRNGTRRFD
jgi:hypothetical protein